VDAKKITIIFTVENKDAQLDCSGGAGQSVKVKPHLIMGPSSTSPGFVGIGNLEMQFQSLHYL
jgi:hypothetical protein